MDENIVIRRAVPVDLEGIANVEGTCFPKAEAASRDSLKARLAQFSEHFWLMTLNGEIIAYVGGCVTNQPDLSDEMYENAALHTEDGAWQMLFSVCTLPAFQRRGYAGQLLECAALDAKAQGRKGVVLTCKERLLPFYAKFGFVNEGISASVHGNAVWYQMRLTF